MYYPERSAYECPGCRKWWMPPEMPVACAVNHLPGTCCHYGEAECEPPKPAAS